VLLSVQRALLDEVFPSLESLWLHIDSHGVKLLWCVDGTLSSEDRDSLSSVEAEMQGDFDKKFEIRSTVLPAGAVRRKAQRDRPSAALACVYQRRSF
jgi:hypothetical protein